MTHGAYILARYSTDNQNPDSIEVQVDKCSSWCKEHNLPVLGVYADYAVSGMKDSRPQQSRMMEDLRAGGADTVVIYDQSRMFRKMTAWFQFREQLQNIGASVVSVTQPQIGKDLRDPTNFLTEGTMALFNQIWALQTRQKVISKMEYMARNGQFTGGPPPLGYQLVNGKLTIHPQESRVVQRIFSEYAAGSSYRQIIAGLNADGHVTRRGNPFGNNSLHDLLKNERYIGTLCYNKAVRNPDGSRNTHARPGDHVIRVENAVPAIIDIEVWKKVQIRMKQNKRDQSGAPATRREYPLKGKVFCANCKSALVVSIVRGRYYYYACSGRERRHICDFRRIRVDQLEQRVADCVRAILGSPDNMELFMSVVRRSRQQLQQNAVDKLRSLQRRRVGVAKQLDSATDAVLKGLFSESLTQKIHALEAELSTIDQDLKTLRGAIDGSALPDSCIQSILNEVLNNDFSDASILLSIVTRVEVGPENITIWTILDPPPDDESQLSPSSYESDIDPTPVPPTSGAGSPPPYRANPNTVFFVKHTFGFVLTLKNADF